MYFVCHCVHTVILYVASKYKSLFLFLSPCEEYYCLQSHSTVLRLAYTAVP